MKKYVLVRLLKSIVSIFVVVSIVIGMTYTMIPREKVFENDPTKQKLRGDDLTTYMYGKWDELGYLDYQSFSNMCKAKADNYNACMQKDPNELEKITTAFENDGYVVNKLNSGDLYAYRDFGVFEQIGTFYSKLLKIDTPNAVTDSDNPDLERKYYFGSDQNGLPALMCSGCEYKYQIYLDGSFPFIHQNMIKLNFGTSYPTKQGVDTMSVIGDGQGKQEAFEQTFPTGYTTKSAILQHSCKYKPSSTLDHLDAQRFNDNYANCSNNYESPSMIQTSFFFGIVALVIAYVISIPVGVLMARKKGKLADKIGIVYINFLIATPSLAFIYIIKMIGQMGFNLPDKFPQLGFDDPRSYVLPIIILALLQTPSLMMWLRRYMIDQSNADYVKFARAKGLTESEIFNKHILKNAIIPIVNGIPTSIVLCISGAVITESVFSIPGMGKMLPDSIKAMNNNMIVNITFILTTLSVFAVLIGDILMTIVDPRIQLTTKGGSK